MSNFWNQRIQPQSTEAPILEATLDWWRHSGGVIDARSDRLDRIYNHIQFAYDDPFTWPPPFLHVGPKTMIAELWGQDFAKRAAGSQSVPDVDAERDLMGLYREVSHVGQPEAEYLKLSTDTIFGNVRVAYQRIVLPATLRNGKPIFVTATHTLRMARLVGGTDFAQGG